MRKARTAIAIAACTFELQAVNGAIQIFPAGTFDAPRGAMRGKGPWSLNAAAAARLIDQIAALSGDMVIDYEHQTLLSEINGQPAPAAGWMSSGSFEWREGQGLFLTDPRWTEKAAAHIAAREYKYISPVFAYDSKTGGVTRLLHASLTNNPAIDGMNEIELRAAAKFSTDITEENDDMNLELLKLLGLAESASDDVALAALKAVIDAKTEADEALAALKADVEKKDDAIAALKGGEPDPKKFVSVDVVEELKAQVAALSSGINENEVEALVAEGLEDGRLVAAQEKWARKLGKSDVATLKEYLDDASPIAALTGKQTDGGQSLDKDGNVVLSQQQVAVCKSMGICEDDYKKQLAEDSKEAAAT